METWFSSFKFILPGIFPELFFFFSICIFLLFGTFFTEKKLNGSFMSIVSLVISKIAILVFFFTFLLIFYSPFENISFFFNSLAINPFIKRVKLFVLFFCFIVIFIGFDYIKKERINSFEYIILILFSCLGIFLLISAQDLITFYLAIEIQSLSFYSLASYIRNSAFSTEAGLKYFILGAFSSGLLLFGFSLLYAFTGRLNLEEINLFFSGINEFSPGIYLSILCIFVSIFFKLSAAPFHTWAPDVYEGAPTSIRAFFAIVPKFLIFSLVCRLLFSFFFNLFYIWQIFLLFCCLTSILIATFSALTQRKLKRFFVFSSIGHLGFLLLGLSTGRLEGLEASFLYLFIYIIRRVFIWSFILILKNSSNLNEKISSFLFFRQLKNFRISNPLLSFSFCIVIFSFAGTPPLAGFFAKIKIFFSAIENSIYLISIIGVVCSVISAFYYLRFIKLVYFDKRKFWFILEKIDKIKSLIFSFSFFFVFFFFIYPSPFLIFIHEISIWVLV